LGNYQASLHDARLTKRYIKTDIIQEILGCVNSLNRPEIASRGGLFVNLKNI